MVSIPESSNALIVVTGGSGRVGKSVLRDLSRRGRRVRALTREPGERTPLPGVQWVYADLARPSTLAPALEGGKELFLLTSNDEGMVAAQTYAIAAAVACGIEHVVKQSALGASDHSKSPVARGHYEVEGTLRASGLAWTALRPHYFMDNLLAQAPAVRSTGELRSPLGPARIPFVDTVDIAAVAAEVLATSGYRGEKLVLTGGSALSYQDVASEMSAASGRSIRYREQTMDEARQALAATGATSREVESMVALWGYQRAGGPTAGVSPDVTRVLGREPRRIRQFLEDHRSEFGFERHL